MDWILTYIKLSYRKIIHSIAFLPSLISLVFLFFSFLILSIEYSKPIEEFKEYLPSVLVKGPDNARMILATVIGGVISLTVFSFSMVMIVLNRASASLSPRLIPQLISRKSHQFVLGFYIGTIIFSLILIVNMGRHPQTGQIPSLGILLSMALTITCLGLFVYFINSISLSIQVDVILRSIYWKTLKQISREDDKHNDHSGQKVPDEWYPVSHLTKNGYFCDLDEERLVNLLKKNDLVGKVSIHEGTFIIEDFPFFFLNKKISDEENIQEQLISCFDIHIEERMEKHYLYGFKQITEVAVKALSPGINDIRTALKAIDLLTILFIKKMKSTESYNRYDHEDQLRLLKTNPGIDFYLEECFTPIRIYGRNDVSIMQKLLISCKGMLYTIKGKENFEKIVVDYARTILEDIENNTENKNDLKNLREAARDMNEILSDT